MCIGTLGGEHHPGENDHAGKQNFLDHHSMSPKDGRLSVAHHTA